MSSLPPYNPPRSQRIAWLLHQDGAAEAIAAAGPDLGGVAAAWSERTADRDRLSALVDAPIFDNVEWHPLAPGSEAAVAVAIRDTAGSTLVIAGSQALDALLRELVDLPPGRARLRFIPGLATTVQVLPDRAVLRHLNQGGALLP
ncbi:MAG TPA: hypothetical protein VG329_03890 [Candidatus Dormibacteraeota bacterium]|jgi:hypothetical protein|nr:hypothetical protein [Candidatus Dormibacteraeota bacterium]